MPSNPGVVEDVVLAVKDLPTEDNQVERHASSFRFHEPELLLYLRTSHTDGRSQLKIMDSILFALPLRLILKMK